MANYYLFRCSSQTYPECMQKMLFGQDNNDRYFPVEDIKKGDILFLHNLSNPQFIEGPYWADSNGQRNIDQTAWNGRFPWQVKVSKNGNTKRIGKQSFETYLQYEDNQRHYFSFIIPQDVGRSLFNAFGFSPKVEKDESLTLINNDLSSDEVNFRLIYPANFRTDDGHFVRSTYEVIVDNWLYNNRIPHAYEKIVPGCHMTCDFHIKSKVGEEYFIEVWGMDTPNYLKRKEQKKLLYLNNNIAVINIEKNHIRSNDDIFSEIKHKFNL